MRIVLIDDNHDFLEVLSALLRRRGFRVDAYASGVPSVTDGAVVLLDMHGVSAKPSDFPGASLVLTMSGDPDLSPSIRKPFKIDELVSLFSKQ